MQVWLLLRGRKMNLMEKALLTIGTTLGLLIFVSFFDGIYVQVASTVSATAILFLQMIPLVIIGVLLVVLVTPDKKKQEVMQT